MYKEFSQASKAPIIAETLSGFFIASCFINIIQEQKQNENKNKNRITLFIKKNYERQSST